MSLVSEALKKAEREAAARDARAKGQPAPFESPLQPYRSRHAGGRNRALVAALALVAGAAAIAIALLLLRPTEKKEAPVMEKTAATPEARALAKDGTAGATEGLALPTAFPDVQQAPAPGRSVGSNPFARPQSTPRPNAQMDPLLKVAPTPPSPASAAPPTMPNASEPTAPPLTTPPLAKTTQRPPPPSPSVSEPPAPQPRSTAPAKARSQRLRRLSAQRRVPRRHEARARRHRLLRDGAVRLSQRPPGRRRGVRRRPPHRPHRPGQGPALGRRRRDHPAPQGALNPKAPAGHRWTDSARRQASARGRRPTRELFMGGSRPSGRLRGSCTRPPLPRASP